jgi:hypothetical protein
MAINPKHSGKIAVATGPKDTQSGKRTRASLIPVKLQSDVEIKAYAHQNITMLAATKNNTAPRLLFCARFILTLCFALSIVLGKSLAI